MVYIVVYALERHKALIDFNFVCLVNNYYPVAYGNALYWYVHAVGDIAVIWTALSI